jgi:CRP-like cAMP-binding protein
MPSESDSVRNDLLCALPPDEFRRLINQAKKIAFDRDYVFYEADTAIRDVYFPIEGLVSIVTPLQEGETVEVLVVGREGMVGLSSLDSADYTVPTRAVGQIAGHALKFKADIIRDEFNRAGRLQKNLLHYIHFVMVQTAQNVACNRMHDLEARLAKWLLMVRDRQRSNTFTLTHDFLAQMLGARRSSVTIAAGALQRAGLIHYYRGRIEIIDDEELQQVSCECYAAIRTSWDRLFKNSDHSRAD